MSLSGIDSVAHRGPAKATTVLIVIGQLDVGGAECHLAQVLPLVRAAGFDVTVFALKPGGAIADRLISAGVTVISHATRRDGWPGLLQAAGMLARTVRTKRPDILHFYLPAAYLIGALCTIGASAKRIMSRRSLASYQARYPGIRLLERLLHSRMDVVLANSRAVANDLMNEGVPKQRLGLIRNGVARGMALPDKAGARARLGLSMDTLVIVCIANLIGYKGHGDLIAALGIARDQLPGPWTVLLVGRDDGIGCALRTLAARAGVAEHLQWIGGVGDVADYLDAADIGVLASHEEGFSNAVLEGMAAGLPMVVTAVGGNPEAVLDGECGRVVPVRSPSPLAAALLELASAPELRSRWGEAGRQRVVDHFSTDHCGQLYCELYANLAQDVDAPIPAAATLAVG